MARMWQPSLWYRPKKTRSVSMFVSGTGKRAIKVRHVKRHTTGLKKTAMKFWP